LIESASLLTGLLAGEAANQGVGAVEKLSGRKLTDTQKTLGTGGLAGIGQEIGIAGLSGVAATGLAPAFAIGAGSAFTLRCRQNEQHHGSGPVLLRLKYRGVYRVDWQAPLGRGLLPGYLWTLRLSVQVIGRWRVSWIILWATSAQFQPLKVEILISFDMKIIIQCS
jgi:hypothetical protein